MLNSGEKSCRLATSYGKLEQEMYRVLVFSLSLRGVEQPAGERVSRLAEPPLALSSYTIPAIPEPLQVAILPVHRPE